MKRPVGELIVLMIVGTICISILGAGLAIVIIALFRPEVDVSSGVKLLSGLLNTLFGLLAGLLAGRSRIFSGTGRNGRDNGNSSSE